MAVLVLILKILLCILGAVLLLTVLLLSVRTGVEAVGATGAVSVELHYGLIHVPIYPLPTRKKRKEKPATEKKKPIAQKKKKESRLDWKRLDYRDVIDFALTMLSELTDSLRISRLRVKLLIGTEDASKTGMLLGQISATIGIIVPFLENTFEMKDYHFAVDADFDADHTEWAFTVFCSLRPITVLLLVLRHWRELYRFYKQMKKKDEAIVV